MSASPVQEDGRMNWEQIDQAVSSLEQLDIVEMANHIVTEARNKGAKEAFNEAGSVRYRLAKVRQHVALLQQTICNDTLESQYEKVKALKRANAKKRVLTGASDEPAANQIEESGKPTEQEEDVIMS